MADIKFSTTERDILIKKIRLYSSEELRHEIGQFDAGFMLDFIAREMGAYFYNRGLYDAQAVLQTRLDSIAEAIYEIEKPTDFDNR